jgi:hypothetical protein
MKKNFIGALLLLAVMSISAQSVTYTYDNAGNRTMRSLVLRASQAPEETQEMTTIPDLIAKKAILIYPNPTKGVLSVEIKEYTDGLQAEFRLTDLSGKTIAGSKVTGGYQSFDLSRQPAGVYLLQIRIDGESAVWKIVKE